MANEISFNNVAQSYAFSTQVMAKTLGGLTDEDWLKQPNESTNPMLWVVGHMTATRGFTLRLLGEQWSAPWEKLFDRGAKLLPADQYPTRTELTAAWDEVSNRLAEAMGKASDNQLATSAPPGPPSFDGKVSGTLAFFAFHEAYHVGQAVMLHKWLGYGQVVG